MPELPDIELYRAALAARILDQPLDTVRSLSRLLKADWPKTVEELELRRRGSQ